MNCTSPPGGTCTSTNKTLPSFSNYLTGTQLTTCSTAYTYSYQTANVGFVDPSFCLQVSNLNPPYPISYPSYCCNAQQIYTTPTFSNPTYKPAVNAGKYCEDPNFSIDDCTLVLDPEYPGNEIFTGKQYYWSCPNSGILDALTHTITGTGTTQSWGFGYNSNTAFELAGPYGCYDATSQQSQNLYNIRKQFCPNLDAGYSYSANIADSLNPASWTALSITAACCARSNQTSISDDSGNKCDFTACFQSPQCGQILRDYCSVTTNQRPLQSNASNYPCTRFKSWTSLNLFNQNVTSTTFGASYPANGSYPFTMDQAFFALLTYCSDTQYQDPEFCGALIESDVLNNHLLFPRIDTLQISGVLSQINNSFTQQTISFSITNRSNILLKSLTVIPTSSSFTIAFGTQSLYPGSSTNVTISTTLSSLAYDETYEVEESINWVSDSYNANDDCSYVGTYFLDSSITEPLETDFPPFPSCGAGDLAIGSYTNVGELVEVPLAKLSTDCVFKLQAFDESYGSTLYPGCVCPSESVCVGGLDGSCETKSLLTRELVSGLVCATNPGWNLTGMYFIDSITWLTNILDTTRQDFPLFGGFVVGMQPNPFNYFLTPTLVAFPLTSNNFVN